MKTVGIITLLIVFASDVKSQDIYKGGSGDGADMAELQNISLSVEENSILDLVKIYPTLNSQGFLNIESRVNFEYIIYDTKGLDHKRGTIAEGRSSINVSDLVEGFYFIKLRNQSNEHIRRLVILK